MPDWTREGFTVSKKFTNTDPYDADMDAMWAMLSTQEYWQAKYEALGAKNVVFTTFDVSDDQITLVNERDVPADLPSFAKKIIGDTNHTTQKEVWTRSGDSASATEEIHVKNLPGGTTGTMKITTSGSGTVWNTDFDIKIGIPVVGGKLEGLMKDELGSNFTEEKTFNDGWLADHT